MRLMVAAALGATIALSAMSVAPQSNFRLEIEQITHGPHHHFFGYIGQCRTIPWNRSGRYIVALRTRFHDRMPGPTDAAEIVLIDTQDANRVEVVDSTRAWNFQQGTMLYWNPEDPDYQFFFNDRDPSTNKVYTVLFDIRTRSRVRGFFYPDTPVGNGGVAQRGGWFAAINYGRLARLREVTGYPGAYDWTTGVHAPADDGVFLVNARTGERKLLVSFRELAQMISDLTLVRIADRVRPVGLKRDELPPCELVRYDSSEVSLYINHTLWSRDDSLLFFFVRGRRDKKAIWLDVPCTVRPDGSDLRAHTINLGGHPEWAEGRLLIGAYGRRMVLYDPERMQVVDTLGTPEIFPSPGGDIALSPDGQWLACGYTVDGGSANQYVFYRLSDGAYVRSPKFSRGAYTRGPLRIDPAPRWNREGNAVLVPGWTEDGTRQLFVIRILFRSEGGP